MTWVCMGVRSIFTWVTDGLAKDLLCASVLNTTHRGVQVSLCEPSCWVQNITYINEHLRVQWKSPFFYSFLKTDSCAESKCIAMDPETLALNLCALSQGLRDTCTESMRLAKVHETKLASNRTPRWPIWPRYPQCPFKRKLDLSAALYSRVAKLRYP